MHCSKECTLRPVCIFWLQSAQILTPYLKVDVGDHCSATWCIVLFKSKFILKQDFLLCCNNDVECSRIRKEHFLATNSDGSIYDFFRQFVKYFCFNSQFCMVTSIFLFSSGLHTVL